MYWSKFNNKLFTYLIDKRHQFKKFSRFLLYFQLEKLYKRCEENEATIQEVTKELSEHQEKLDTMNKEYGKYEKFRIRMKCLRILS